MRRKKWRKKRGQLGNTNALQHGGYRDLSAEKLDQRTREAKALNQIEADAKSHGVQIRTLENWCRA